jgi:hypothetical protein
MKRGQIMHHNCILKTHLGHRLLGDECHGLGNRWKHCEVGLRGAVGGSFGLVRRELVDMGRALLDEHDEILGVGLVEQVDLV